MNEVLSSLRTLHVYGARGALCWAEDTTRRGEATIAVEGAELIGEKSYDWSNKIRLQLSANELIELSAVLCGMAGLFQARYHGPDKNKHVTVENQGQHFFVQVWLEKRVVSVRMSAADAFRVGTLAVAQVKKANDDAEGSVVLTLLRNVGKMMSCQEPHPARR